MIADSEQLVAFHALRCRMIDLEDAQPVGDVPLPQAEGIQAGAENDVLPGSGGDRVAQVVLGKAEAQDVLGVDRLNGFRRRWTMIRFNAQLLATSRQKGGSMWIA